MKLLIKDVDLVFLSSSYENVNFYMFCSDDHLSFMSCLACVCDNSDDIVENWRSIQNSLAFHHLRSEGFDAWNLYVVFVSEDTISIWDKYEIENDKFSARKIVLDGFEGTPSPDRLISELNNQLLGADLVLECDSDKLGESLILSEKFYRGVPLDSKNDSREKRASLINKLMESLSSNEN